MDFMLLVRLRTGNVIFNYRYYNNTLQKTEGQSCKAAFSCYFIFMFFIHSNPFMLDFKKVECVVLRYNIAA